LDVSGGIQADSLFLNENLTADTVKADVVVINNFKLQAPDYVFEKGYNLKPLHEIEMYVKANKHLPGVPSRKEIQHDGIDLAQMNMILLKKIEELTIHAINQQKEIDLLKKQIAATK
jgi:hypothetical protein